MRTFSCNRPNIGLNVTYRSKVKKHIIKDEDNMTICLPSVIVLRLIKLLFVVGIHFLVHMHSYMHVYFCACSICLIFCHFSLSSLKGFWTSKCNVTPPNSHNPLKWLCNSLCACLFRLKKIILMSEDCIKI